MRVSRVRAVGAVSDDGTQINVRTSRKNVGKNRLKYKEVPEKKMVILQ